MTRRFISGAVVGLLGLVLIMSGCGQTSHNEAITLGGMFALSGNGAAWGQASQNGIELAIADINKDGGIDGTPLRAIYDDYKGDAKGALSSYLKLRNQDGVRIILGPTWSDAGQAIKEVVAQDETIMISPTLGIADVNEHSDFIFNTWPHDATLSSALGEYVYDKGHRRVAILGGQQVWVTNQTAAAKAGFEARGGVVPFVSEPLLTETQVQTDITKLKSENVDAVILTNGNYNLGVLYAKKMRELGMELPLYSITLDRQLIEQAEGAFDGLEFLTFLTPTASFAERYESTFGTPIDIGADSAYDAVMMLAKAMKETNSSNPTDLAAYLNAIELWEGESGTLTSDGKGGFEKPYNVFRVENGEPVSL